jgi:hypothetical protein
VWYISHTHDNYLLIQFLPNQVQFFFYSVKNSIEVYFKELLFLFQPLSNYHLFFALNQIHVSATFDMMLLLYKYTSKLVSVEVAVESG